jgi:ribosomal protein L44E
MLATPVDGSTMGAIHDGSDGVTEYCPACGRETAHTVEVQIRTESDKKENAQFSREPYRVSTCRTCGGGRTQRMNNA